MASFETDLKKLQKLWEKGQLNEIVIQTSQVNNSIKNNQIEELSPRVLQINTLTDIGQGYTNLVILGQNSGGYNVYGMNWIITANIPEAWIPFARFNVGYNAVGLLQIVQEISIETPLTTPNGVDPFGLYTQ